MFLKTKPTMLTETYADFLSSSSGSTPTLKQNKRHNIFRSDIKQKLQPMVFPTYSGTVPLYNEVFSITNDFLYPSGVVTKISSSQVFVVSSRGSRKQSWSTSHPPPPSHPLPQEGFEVQLLPFLKRQYRPKKAIFIKSTAIISGFMMITSLLKKTTTF